MGSKFYKISFVLYKLQSTIACWLQVKPMWFLQQFNCIIVLTRLIKKTKSKYGLLNKAKKQVGISEVVL